MRTRLYQLALIVPIALGSAAVLGACDKGGGTQAPKIVPGEMPLNATWNGVYFSTQFGNLHLVETGESIAGKWKSTDGSKWGELNGPVQGNVLHFEWTEHKIGMVGPTSVSKGKGYFVYKRPAGENVDDVIKGEWGLGENEAGNEWDGVKQRNLKPDLKSIGGEQEPGGPTKEWK